MGSGVEFVHPVHPGVCPDPPRHCTTPTVQNRLCSSTATCTNEEASSYPHNPGKEEEKGIHTSGSERGGLEQREQALIHSPHFVVG